MKPSLSLPFMNSQPVSPAELLTKLSNIKSANETSNMKLKQLREIQQKMSSYEIYCLDIMNSLQGKLSSLNKEVNELKKNYKKAQNLGVVNFDKVQRMLQNTLEEYENDRRKGQQMIKKMVTQIEDKLQRSVLQKSIQSSQLCEQYLKLNNRLQSIVQSLQSMQSQLISQYSKLRLQMNERLFNVERSILEEIEEIEKNTQNLLKKIQKIQEECENQIDKINQKKQQRRYKLHQIMQKMIQDAVNSDQDQ